MPHNPAEVSRSEPEGQAAIRAMLAAVGDMGLPKPDQAAVQLAISVAYWHGKADGLEAANARVSP